MAHTFAMSESENSYHSDSHVMASFGCLLDAAGFQLVCSSQSNRYIELFARVIGCVMKVVVRCESQTLCCKYVYIFFEKRNNDNDIDNLDAQ